MADDVDEEADDVADDKTKLIQLDEGMATKLWSWSCWCRFQVTARSQAVRDASVADHQLKAHSGLSGVEP